jgi:phosphoglycerol transferase
VPFEINTGDSLFNLVMIKNMLQHGWDLTNPSLGAPFGQELYDYPALSGDSLYMLMLKVLGIFFANPATVVNVFYLLGFPLIALFAYGIMRILRISTAVAFACAVIYAVLPFRFDSSETHIFLSSYFTVPVSCYLILTVFKGSELFTRKAGASGPRAYLTWRSAALLAVCVVVGCADNYFALFTVALMAPAALLCFLTARNRRALIGALAAIAVILATIFLNVLPTVIYHAQHGADTLVTTRLPEEAEDWSLSLANLVLPIEGNRIPVLAHLAHEFNFTVKVPYSTPIAEPAWMNLGLFGTLGLLWLALLLGVYCVRPERAPSTDRRGVYAALGAGMAFLIGTAGGLATLFAYIVTPQLHVPSRIGLFIAFFAILGAALGLDQLRARLAVRPHGRRLFLALLPALLALGVLYQTSPSMAPEYTLEAAKYHEIEAFVHTVEAQLPENASIFQIPNVPFPQGEGVNGIGPYENLYGFVFSDRLRWTGGAMEGRPTNWVPAVLRLPTRQVLEDVSALDFAGIYLETAGLKDAGARLIPELSRTLGVQPLVGAEGRLMFFSMADYNRRLRERYSPAQLRSIAANALHPQA